jgi:hypothetical protein
MDHHFTILPRNQKVVCHVQPPGHGPIFCIFQDCHLPHVHIWSNYPLHNKFVIKKIKNQKFIMQSKPCESKLLMVKNIICYCIFGVYLVTGTKIPDISQEGTF